MAKKTDIPADRLQAFERLVATIPQVERKGASMPYTSVNGHMFSFLTSDGTLALRLPEAEREAFLKQHKTSLCVQHGRTMKEYVVVPASLLKKTQRLKKYFGQSFDYASSLKPKPTNRRAPKKKTAKKMPAKKK